MVRSEALYIRHLSALEGKSFEDEVCTCLQSRRLDFQRITEKPDGDGGLDGLSHGQTRAYCCYGPELSVFKGERTALKRDIVKKLSADLRRILELETHGRTRLNHKSNEEIKDILAPGKKIGAIYLVLNNFETNKIVGPINRNFEKYKEVSEKNYVADNVSVVIWGPKDVAAHGIVDELALRRIEQIAMLSEARKSANDNSIGHRQSENFEAKFLWLEQALPGKKKRIAKLQKMLREEWTVALSLDHRLAESSVTVHESLENLRREAAFDAELESLDTDDPLGTLKSMRLLMSEKLHARFCNDLVVDLIESLAMGETARLAGECPLDWRP